MASPFAVIDTIFNRPRDAAAILFLIEDSCDTALLWQRLGDTYIPYLLDVIKNANPSTAVSLSLRLSLSHRSLPFRPRRRG